MNTEDGVEFTAASIIFSSKTYLKLYFTAPEGAEVTIGGGAVTPVKEGDEYYVVITAPTPDKMTDMNTVVISVDGSVVLVAQDVSIAAMVKVGIEANLSDEFTELLNAYGWYGMYASQYIA